MSRRWTALALLFSLAAASAASDPAIAYPAIASAPVAYAGRTMPFESAGRLILHRFEGARPSRDEAVSWLLSVLLDPFTAAERQTFLVEDPAVFDAVGMRGMRRGRVSYADLYPHLASLDVLAGSLASAARPLDASEQRIVRLAEQVRLFEGLASTLDVFRAEDGDSGYEQLVRTGTARASETLEVPGMLRVVPVELDSETVWVSPAAAVARLSNGGPPARETRTARVLRAWNDLTIHGADAGGDGSPQIRYEPAATLVEGAPFVVRAETLYWTLRPLFWTAVAAAVAIAAAAWSSGGPTAGIRGSNRLAPIVARTAGALTLVAMTAHQVLRLVITGRPPVTDLPSSFLFVAWILITAGFAQSLRRGKGASGATLAGGSALVLVYLARLVSGAADPFAVVQAILDTNFWLMTHVLVITSGYAGVIAAGVLGHVSLVDRALGRVGRGSDARGERAIVPVAIAGLALTTLGTVLGGIWADQAWGRFWGWDPKENGALLIILWQAAALHARRTRLLGPPGFDAAMVMGVAIVIFSWLGVNLMGVGLHSYGFREGSLAVVVAVIALETAFVLTGLVLARRRWTPTGDPGYTEPGSDRWKR